MKEATRKQRNRYNRKFSENGHREKNKRPRFSRRDRRVAKKKIEHQLEEWTDDYGFRPE